MMRITALVLCGLLCGCGVADDGVNEARIESACEVVLPQNLESDRIALEVSLFLGVSKSDALQFTSESCIDALSDPSGCIHCYSVLVDEIWP